MPAIISETEICLCNLLFVLSFSLPMLHGLAQHCIPSQSPSNLHAVSAEFF